MAESMNRYFRLIPASRRVKPSGRLWRPAADVYQTKDGWIVKVELAGVCAEDLEIDIQGDTLYITGCRRDAFYGEGVSYHQLEIKYSRFEKTLRFPSQIEGATLTRDYCDGLLIIRLHSEKSCEEGEK
jgi:HSP20 family protein